VFTRTKHGADKLTRQLNADGIGALAIHGNKSQSARNRALGDFKDRRVRVLVATDIAARGIDIDRLPHVVNFDLPNVPEDYVHRIGRTGRAGAAGQAISLVSVDEHAFLRDIERLLRKPIRRQTIAGFEPDPTAVAHPVPPRRGPGPAAHTRNGVPPRASRERGATRAAPHRVRPRATTAAGGKPRARAGRRRSVAPHGGPRRRGLPLGRAGRAAEKRV
jgi:ATP-dependent RNA helicase RhlE